MGPIDNLISLRNSQFQTLWRPAQLPERSPQVLHSYGPFAVRLALTGFAGFPAQSPE
jgi:hypothetical protein